MTTILLPKALNKSQCIDDLAPPPLQLLINFREKMCHGSVPTPGTKCILCARFSVTFKLPDADRTVRKARLCSTQARRRTSARVGIGVTILCCDTMLLHIRECTTVWLRGCLFCPVLLRYEVSLFRALERTLVHLQEDCFAVFVVNCDCAHSSALSQGCGKALYATIFVVTRMWYAQVHRFKTARMLSYYDPKGEECEVSLRPRNPLQIDQPLYFFPKQQPPVIA